MELGAKNNRLPFLTARARMVSRYGINIDKDTFIERAYYIWRDIGNIAPTNRRFSITVPPDRIVELPSDCEFLRTVTTDDGILPNTAENTSRGRYSYDSTGIQAEVLPDAAMTSATAAVRASKSYQYGEDVNYTTGDGFIEISSATMINRTVTIQYQSIAVDKDGLPMINEREASAISANMALQEAEKSMFAGTKGAEIMVQYLKQEADRLMLAAKIPEKITDDAIDKVLDIKTSWNRKVYGRKFNMIY